MTESNIPDDQNVFAGVLYHEQDPIETLRLIGGMGIEAAQLSTAIPVPPDTMERWIAGSAVGIEEHVLAIDTLKSTVLYTLRRGIVGPRLQGLWYAAPNERLDGRTPLATLPMEGGAQAVIRASATFTRPEPLG